MVKHVFNFLNFDVRRKNENTHFRDVAHKVELTKELRIMNLMILIRPNRTFCRLDLKMQNTRPLPIGSIILQGSLPTAVIEQMALIRFDGLSIPFCVSIIYDLFFFFLQGVK